MKLNGRKTVDPTSLVDDPTIAPQTASQIVSMKPAKVWKLVEVKILTRKPQQLNMIKETIRNVCKSQALTQRHAADATDHLAGLADMVSVPILLKVINVTMMPVVAIKIPKVDDMMEKAQAKVDAI